MEPLETSKDELTEVDEDNASSVDEFIKQLEEREKDLDISSDLVIEVGDSEVKEDNIHDSFIAQPEFALPIQAKEEAKPQPKVEIPGTVPSKHENEEVEALKAERDEFRETLLRQKRDFDNYRQRTERERKAMFRNILGSLATQMLPVLDNLNRALDATVESESQAEGQDLKVFFDGIVLVNQQLNEVLTGMGVQPIPSVGEPFDPNIHEAVASEETDEFPPKTVIQELLRGYRIDEKVIRASMVKVSAAKQETSESNDE